MKICLLSFKLLPYHIINTNLKILDLNIGNIVYYEKPIF